MITKFIAEIGSNHNQDLTRTRQLIDKAKEIGCWGVKFQLFRAEQLYAPEFKSQINKMKKWELPISYIEQIKIKCQDLDLKFICTPFDLTAVKILEPYVDYYKIGSYENQWEDLIATVAATNIPWMISLGMTTIKDILYYNLIWTKLYHSNSNLPIIVFHCNSNYPAIPENCNLNYIRDLKDIFSLVGWSDHTVEPGIIYKAIAFGAQYIEFHFDLENMLGFESEVGHCWAPNKIKQVIHNVKIGELAEAETDTNESQASKWRTDPEDGLRPLKEFRKELLNDPNAD